jgi:hypothetical protein
MQSLFLIEELIPEVSPFEQNTVPTTMIDPEVEEYVMLAKTWKEKEITSN